MRTALDTNVLSAVLAGERNAPAISRSLDDYRNEGLLLISPIVYAEICAFPRMEETFFGNFMNLTQIEIEYRMDESVWTLAGRRFARYTARRRANMNTGPRRLLPDFIIGAHALVHADRLMTFDTARFRLDFPELPLLTPSLQ